MNKCKYCQSEIDKKATVGGILKAYIDETFSNTKFGGIQIKKNGNKMFYHRLFHFLLPYLFLSLILK